MYYRRSQSRYESLDEITRDDKFTYGPLYHWFFHAQPDVPEMLTHGKEREYITSFYNRLVSPYLLFIAISYLKRQRPKLIMSKCYNPDFYTKEDLDVCELQYRRSLSTKH